MLSIFLKPLDCHCDPGKGLQLPAELSLRDTVDVRVACPNL